MVDDVEIGNQLGIPPEVKNERLYYVDLLL